MSLRPSIGQYRVVSIVKMHSQSQARTIDAANTCLQTWCHRRHFQICCLTTGEQSLPFVLPHKRVSSRRCVSRRKGTPFLKGGSFWWATRASLLLSLNTTRTVPTTLPWGWYFVLCFPSLRRATSSSIPSDLICPRRCCCRLQFPLYQSPLSNRCVLRVLLGKGLCTPERNGSKRWLGLLLGLER